MNLYVCGLDTSERTIYGSIIETDGGQTVKQFCSPNDLHSVSRELDAFLLNDRRPKDLTLCAPDYSLDVQQILEPLWRKGFQKCIPPESSWVDRMLLRAYRLQHAYWDRSHLAASLALQEHSQGAPLPPRRFCVEWAWQNTLDKLHRLQLLRTRLKRPDWLREPTRCTIDPLRLQPRTFYAQETVEECPF